MSYAYMPRIADKKLEFLLKSSGAVLIVGPKWCGKTESAKQMAKSIIYMQDPDEAENYQKLASLKPSELLIGETPRLIDEWQDAPGLWNAVRHVVDQRAERGQFILTGSVVPNMTKNMHSGAGRIARLTMRTMSLYEQGVSTGEISLTELFDGVTKLIGTSSLSIDDIAHLILRGGWPQTATEPDIEIAVQNVKNYVETLINDDISRIDGKRRSVTRVRSLLRSISRHISSPAANATIMRDMKAHDETISDKTVADYLNVLKKLFVIEDLSVWNASMRSKVAMRTSPKRHLTDPSIASLMLGATKEKLFRDFNTFGFLFESLAVRDLRVYADSLNGSVFFYRDKLSNEVDAIIELDDGRWCAIEVKMGSGEEDEAASKLIKFAKNVNTEKMGKPSFLAIVTATKIGFRRDDGVFVIPLGCLKP